MDHIHIPYNVWTRTSPFRTNSYTELKPMVLNWNSAFFKFALKRRSDRVDNKGTRLWCMRRHTGPNKGYVQQCSQRVTVTRLAATISGWFFPRLQHSQHLVFYHCQPLSALSTEMQSNQPSTFTGCDPFRQHHWLATG